MISLIQFNRNLLISFGIKFFKSKIKICYEKLTSFSDTEIHQLKSRNKTKELQKFHIAKTI